MPKLPPLEEIIKNEGRNLSPSLRIDFAGFLGAYVRNRHPRHGITKRFDKTIDDQRIVSDIVEKSRRLGARKVIRKRRRLKIYSRNLMRALEKGLGNFDFYVADDGERIAFLRSYFDLSRLRVDQSQGQTKYRIVCQDDGTKRKLARSFFELGIYPFIQRGILIIRGYQSLYRFHNLKLDRNNSNREVIRKHLNRQKEDLHLLPKYYAVRKRVSQALEQKEESNYRRLARELKVPINALPYWIADLTQRHGARNKYPRRKPYSVSSYEKLLELLELPNIYTADEPVRRSEKIFLPAGDKIYLLPPDTQQKFCLLENKEGLDDEDLNYLQEQLRPGPPSRKRYFNLIVEGDIIREIKWRKEVLKAREKCLQVKGKIYRLPPNMQRRYFHIYGLKPKPLNEEYLRHLQGELEVYLSRKPRDLNFRINRGKTITNLILRESGRKG